MSDARRPHGWATATVVGIKSTSGKKVKFSYEHSFKHPNLQMSVNPGGFDIGPGLQDSGEAK